VDAIDAAERQRLGPRLWARRPAPRGSLSTFPKRAARATGASRPAGKTGQARGPAPTTPPRGPNPCPVGAGPRARPAAAKRPRWPAAAAGQPLERGNGPRHLRANPPDRPHPGRPPHHALDGLAERALGWVQFGLWLLRPRVVREFRGHATSLGHTRTNTDGHGQAQTDQDGRGGASGVIGFLRPGGRGRGGGRGCLRQ